MNPTEQVGGQVGDINSFLLHRVAFAHGDSVVVFGVEVIGHAEGRADLVLAAVAFADGASVVVFGADVGGAEGLLEFAGGCLELLGEGQDGGLDGGNLGGEVEDDADVFVLVRLLRGGGVFLVGVAVHKRFPRRWDSGPPWCQD